MKYLKIITPITFILLISFFFRLYKAPTFFLYGHDQDLIGWFVRDVWANHHIRLIGQETSTQGIFIGPYFYYFLIPFYLLTKLDVVGGTLAVAVISVFETASLYYIFSKIWGKNAGFLAAFFHATSFFLILIEREVVPTQPIMLWTAWFIFFLYQILKGNQKYFLLGGLLLSLIWNINMSLILLAPLISLALILSNKKLNIKYTFLGLIILITLSTPLIFFEVRHNFLQTKSFVLSLTTNQKDVVSGADKVARTFHLTAKNIANLFTGTDFPIRFWHVALFIGISFLFLVLKKVIDKKLAIILVCWFALIFGFFSVYSKVLSEYYLNGLNIIFFLIFTLLTDFFLKQKNKVYKLFGIFLVGIFSLINIYRFSVFPINQSSYIQKKQLIDDIKIDAEKHGYSCISISYITDPGYNLGYRYFFWRESMHVNNPISASPVYSIVFPLSRVDRVDKSFGALGLIFPDYKKYTKEAVKESCSGLNSNDTDPMFGFAN
ncbi:glycosyltransferase family 39 protein [Candidatus Woesebacteria bacterium]|nr:glycosyltransferase family 39 protein [Candidatus Woesebacteria bacterium]QQG47025.1 MAG: glycosyltransferase family 39 protein [Candidatus Woesebacteria bacterium]